MGPPKAGSKRFDPTSAQDRLAAVINDHEGMTKGSRVWYKADDQSWVSGELRSQPPPMHHQKPNGMSHSASTGGIKEDELHKAQVHIDDASHALSPVDRSLANKTLNVPVSRLVPANPKLQDGIPDLTHLSYLNEPGILFNLQHRYARDDIYTFAGPVLIALNPCKNLPLYTTEVANAYKAGARDTMNTLAPHIYLVAANAFRKMLRERQSQSLIVNGESGAGKTETTKKAMQYFATLAGGTGIEDQVLETNPVLEAFGNAKTLRNHNSSRFGKLIQIHFNKSNHICGACIKTYLLEKSRVVHQLQGERSYHIFYQLVKGANALERNMWKLPDKPQGFRFLSKSGCTEIQGVDDAAEFKIVRTAMLDVGVSEEAQVSLFGLVSGMLWLGNLDFEANKADRSNDSCLVVRNDALMTCSKLLGLDPDTLSTGLTQKRIVTPSEIITKLLNVEEAKDCRDALAKAMYAAIFQWIVEMINGKLDAGKRGSDCLSISILDIYGFEQFQKNSFEQLCINYANERLQQQFTRHLFTLEQEEYESEGIDWTKVEFTDNQDCVDVIEMAPPKGLGVLAVLDSQCKFPRATDDTFVHKLRETLSGHSHFALPAKDPQDFIILHYAGQVQYNSQGFLDKNKDMLNNDLIEVMVASRHELLKAMGMAVRDDNEGRARNSGQTVGGRFSGQLRELIADLDTTGLHFVRCIKPNSKLIPNSFESAMTLHQLRCCGVLEVARIARAGFPTRYEHSQFAERYSILLPKEEQAILSQGGSALAACHMLVQKFQLNADQYQVGKNKIFFRPGVLGYVEDMWARIQHSALYIQSYWRMHRENKRYLRLRHAATCVQTLYRSKCDYIAYQMLIMQTRAARTIQFHWRAYHARLRFTRMRRSAVLLQCCFRYHRFLKRVRKRQHQAEKEKMLVMLRKKEEEEQLNNVLKEGNLQSVAELRDALKNRDALTMELETARIKQLQLEEALNREREEMERRREELARKVQEEMEAKMQQEIEAKLAKERERLEAEVAASGAARALPGANGGPLSGSMTSQRDQGQGVERFELTKELNTQLEKLQLENMKLQKQLQLERSLKDRYQQKYEEHNVIWLEQIRTLQEYIQQVRDNLGDHKLPQLPMAAMMPPMASGLNPGGSLGTRASFDMGSSIPSPALPSARDPSATTNGPLAPPPMLSGPSYGNHDMDFDARSNATGMSMDRMTNSMSGYDPHGHTGPSDYSRPPEPLGTHGFNDSGGNRGFDRQGRISGAGSNMASSPFAEAQPEHHHHHMQHLQHQLPHQQFQAANPTQRYVNNLSSEMDNVGQVLNEDVKFIIEVKQGVAAAPDMDPLKELNKLRRKYEVWKKDFKGRLQTAEDVLKKLDKGGGLSAASSGMPPSQSSGGYDHLPPGHPGVHAGVGNRSNKKGWGLFK